MQEVFEPGRTKADRNILDNTDKKRSRQQSDEQGQKSIWMFPSNKTALYDKEKPVALLPVRGAYQLLYVMIFVKRIIGLPNPLKKANKTDPDLWPLFGRSGSENSFFYQ